MQPIKCESDLEDKDDESEKEDTDDWMVEEDNINELLLAPGDEDYDMALSSPLGNPYTQLTFSASSPPATPVSQHHSSLIMQSSTQHSVDWDLHLLHWQPSTTAFSQHVVWSSTKDNSAKVTAPSPSQFTKVNPKAKPAPARMEAILSQCYLCFFLCSTHQMDS
jgi:hypothetical protein